MSKLNRDIQKVWIWIIAVTLLLSIFNMDFLGGLAFIAIFMGANHICVSAFDVFFTEEKEYLLHFVLTVMYFIVLITRFKVSMDPGGPVLIFILISMPIFLAIYFWYITFTKFKPAKSKMP